MRFNRRMQPLPPVKPIIGENTIEPLSVCRVVDGTLFIVNQYDDDIWRVDRQGRAFPLGWSQSGPDLLNQPVRLEYSSTQDILVILDRNGVHLSRNRGTPSPILKILVKQPACICVSNDELWIAGEGLGCISLKKRTSVFFVPVDSLISWQAYPPADLTLSYDTGKLYILPENNSGVAYFDISRPSNRQP